MCGPRKEIIETMDQLRQLEAYLAGFALSYVTKRNKVHNDEGAAASAADQFTADNFGIRTALADV